MGYSQAVRHRTLTATCVGSNPASPAICGSSSVVEYNLAKVGVAGSNPVFRSKFWRHSQVVRQRSAKPLPPVRIRLPPPIIISMITIIYLRYAGVAELADAQDLKSCGR